MMIVRIRKVTTRKEKIKKNNLQINKIIRLKSKKRSPIRVKNEFKVIKKINNNKKFKKVQKLSSLNNLNKWPKVRLIVILWISISNKHSLTY